MNTLQYKTLLSCNNVQWEQENYGIGRRLLYSFYDMHMRHSN